MTTISEHRLYLLENGIVEPCADDLAGLLDALRDLRDALAKAQDEAFERLDLVEHIDELEGENGRLEDRIIELEDAANRRKVKAR